MVTVTTKVCFRCNHKKTAQEFHRSINGIGGLHGYCKLCQHTFHIERRKRLIESNLCVICARAAPEEGRTRCEGCRLRQNFNTKAKYSEKRSKRDPVG